jgi:hypothetical protein
MGVGQLAGALLRVDKVTQGLRKGFASLVARVRALRDAVRVDNVRLAQRLRMKLVPYLRRLDAPIRNDVLRLFQMSGLWVRNIGDRRDTKRAIQRMSRRIIQRLDVRTTHRWQLGRELSATRTSTA